ncbi:MAG: ankyrin repeat domain-containing protein [Paludibaculum sp.]
MQELLQAIQNRDLEAMRAALDGNPAWAAHARPVLTAAGGAYLDGLQLLTTRGAGLNGVWRGYRPLHALLQEHPHAAADGPDAARLACLDWMLAQGADPELSAAWPPARALVIASFVGSPVFIDHLRAGGAKVDPFIAAALGDTARIRKTLTKQASFATDRDISGLTALHCAAGSRLPGFPTLPAARLLIEAGADVKARAKSWDHEIDAVYLAAGAKNTALFELLLQKGADSTEALVPALWNGNEELSAIAMTYGADPNKAIASDQPLLNNLIRWGQFKQAFWLLARGASPDLADKRGWTAMHQAASRGNEKMLRALLDAGGDKTRRDAEGETPHNIAENAGKAKIIAMLS